MLHKGFKRCLRFGSMSTDRKTNSKYDAFSIAEMLVVLGIVSFLAIGLPAVHFKKTELKTQRSLHGRYECYYNGGTLMEYSVNESGVATGPVAVASCTFVPPPSAVYFFVHAVGGGGGGVPVSSSPSISNKTENGTVSRNAVSLYPQWMKDVMLAKQLPDTTLNTYSTTMSGSRAVLQYGISGGAGQTVSMFFPALSGVTITATPGKGGALQAAGGSTTVKFNNTTIITALGGAKGTGSAQSTVWLDGAGSMCIVKDEPNRRFREADFSSNVELDTDTPMASKMAEALGGSGGAGGYSNVTNTGYNATYTVNGVNVSQYVKKVGNCVDPTKCDDGSSSAVCPAQTGRNGALVILW